MNAENLTAARWHLLSATPLPWSREVTESLVELIGETLGFAPTALPDEMLVPVSALPLGGSQHRIALCLGHARPVDMGNVGAGGVSEEEYNAFLIEKVAARLRKRGIECIIVDSYEGSNYVEAMRWLAQHLRKAGVTAAIELHFNASEQGTARGHETLYWEHSTKGIALAQSLEAAFTRHQPDQPARGAKPRNARSRGALFLSLTHCPACIAEPFFGDNMAEWSKFDDFEEADRLADAYTDGIADWVAANP